MEKLILLVAPFAPHVAEELWEKMGHKESVAYQPWPKYEERYLEDDVIEIPIMINGKVKSKLRFPAAAAEADVEKAVMADEKVIAALAGKKISQKKYVPKKIYTIAVS